MGRDHRLRTHEVRKFKGTTVFDWESEPADERPSAFAPGPDGASRPGYAGLEQRRARPPKKRGAPSRPWWVNAIVLLVVGAGVTGVLLRHLHG